MFHLRRYPSKSRDFVSPECKLLFPICLETISLDLQGVLDLRLLRRMPLPCFPKTVANGSCSTGELCCSAQVNHSLAYSTSQHSFAARRISRQPFALPRAALLLLVRAKHFFSGFVYFLRALAVNPLRVALGEALLPWCRAHFQLRQ